MAGGEAILTRTNQRLSHNTRGIVLSSPGAYLPGLQSAHYPIPEVGLDAHLASSLMIQTRISRETAQSDGSGCLPDILSPEEKLRLHSTASENGLT